MRSNDTRPCRICGLAPQIRISAEHGQFCLYYGVRLANDETRDRDNALRQRCIKDGNHFTWPVKGMTAGQLLEWRRQHMDWHLRRVSLKWAMFVGAVSIGLTVLGMILANI